MEVTQEEYKRMMASPSKMSEELRRLQAHGRPKKPREVSKDSAVEYARFVSFLRQCPGIPPDFVTEYHFAAPKGRKHASDIAWPAHRLALEIEGGIFTRRAHGSITGILNDQEKCNLYALMRWHVIRVTPEETEPKNGYAIAMLLAWFQNDRLPVRPSTVKKLPRARKRRKK